MSRSRLAILALLLSPLASITPAQAHGSHGGGGETLEAGEFDFTPIITIEGHGGYDNNLVDHPRHYAIDGMFGGVFEWGLGEGASFAIEAAIGPSLVFGEAEHFYGSIHVEEHGHEEEEEEHAHGHDTEYKRTDINGFLQARYSFNDRLDIALSWNPYYVTANQGDDKRGLKNEIGTELTWSLGDGDVNFALGDGIADLADGMYLSLDHRQGWESDGKYVGTTPIHVLAWVSHSVTTKSPSTLKPAHVSTFQVATRDWISALTLPGKSNFLFLSEMQLFSFIGNRLTPRKMPLAGMKVGSTTSALA